MTTLRIYIDDGRHPIECSTARVFVRSSRFAEEDGDELLVNFTDEGIIQDMLSEGAVVGTDGLMYDEIALMLRED